MECVAPRLLGMYKARQHLFPSSMSLTLWSAGETVAKGVLLETAGGGHIQTAPPENPLTAKTTAHTLTSSCRQGPLRGALPRVCQETV